MDLRIHAISEQELVPFILAASTASGEAPNDAEIERERRMAEPERSMAAFDGPDIVGTSSVFTMPMSCPGGEFDVGFLTSVGVLPTHRRRGINTQLMRRQLDDARDRGELVSVLWASEGGIYGRYGYGLGTIGLVIAIETARSAFVRGYAPSGSMRLVDRHEAVKPILAVNRSTRLDRPGMILLDERRLDYVVSHEHGDEKDRPTFFALHEGDDGVDGFVTYKIRQDWPQGYSRSTLDVRDLQATNAPAHADLWRFVLDVDLIERVEAWSRPLDEPLLHLVREPRRLHARMIDNLWLRLVDLEGALRARRYASDGRLILQIHDPFCPWNEGRYVLEVSEGNGSVVRSSGATADVACTVNEVGAAYLGGTTFRQLHRAGRVQELTDGALTTADTLFGWDPAPWSPYDF
jgi:predicted acetyltransferase